MSLKAVSHFCRAQNSSIASSRKQRNSISPATTTFISNNNFRSHLASLITKAPQSFRQTQLQEIMPSADPTPERSPSPPPSVPTASTPGLRASAFIRLYNDALSNTLKSISYDSFAACFPMIAAQAPDSLRAMHGAFVGRLEGFAKVCFPSVFWGLVLTVRTCGFGRRR